MLIRRMAVLAFAATVTFTGAVAATAQAEETGRPHDRQLLFYNHAYGVLDRATADAIEHSSYLRTFANFQVRTTTGADGQTWTGRYLMGRETYLELFGVGDLPGPDGVFGAGGMGVSTERDGDLTTVLERLAAQGITDPVEYDQTRDFGDGIPVPWFDAVFAKPEYDAFGAWGMEYRQEYFADPRSDTEPAAFPSDVGRERYLADDYRSRLMRDVTGIHMAVTALDLANTVPLLKAGGFALRPTRGGITATRGGTTLRFDLVPLGEIGLRSVDFLTQPPRVVPARGNAWPVDTGGRPGQLRDVDLPHDAAVEPRPRTPNSAYLPVRQTLRSTETTMPRMTASSPSIVSNAGLRGSR